MPTKNCSLQFLCLVEKLKVEKIAKLSVKTQDSSFIAFHSIQCYIIDVLVFGQLAARLDGRKIDVFRKERGKSTM